MSSVAADNFAMREAAPEHHAFQYRKYISARWQESRYFQEYAPALLYSYAWGM